MKGRKIKIVAILAALIFAALYYYIALPAINIHATGFWVFFMVLILVVLVSYIVRKRYGKYEIKESKVVRVIGAIFLLVLIVYIVGSLLSSSIFNAKKYQKLLTVEDGEFTKDIEELSYDQIPLLDKASATLLGNRKMGSMIDMASQFEVDEIYSQINYQDKPVRVSPLKYASPIKWLTNRAEGIPAYIMIDMATQSTELVKL